MPLFFLLVLSFVLACSKSGSATEQDSPVVAEMMQDEPEDSGDSGSNDEGSGNGGNEQGGEDNNPALIMGEFMDGAHPTSGTATVNVERTELVLKDFKSDAGPILEFILQQMYSNGIYNSWGIAGFGRRFHLCTS